MYHIASAKRWNKNIIILKLLQINKADFLKNKKNMSSMIHTQHINKSADTIIWVTYHVPSSLSLSSYRLVADRAILELPPSGPLSTTVFTQCFMVLYFEICMQKFVSNLKLLVCIVKYFDVNGIDCRQVLTLTSLSLHDQINFHKNFFF